ncbi:MAG: hypothetical protein Q9186_005877 [Xanthomendoza sp. 1 TL-2023]
MADVKDNTLLASAEESSQDDSLGVRQRRGSALNTNPWWRFGGKDRSFIPTRAENATSKHTLDNQKDDRDIEDEVNLDDSVFNNPKAFEIYKPIENYEGRHRFDPRATWSEAEEKKLIRRVSKWNERKRLNLSDYISLT